MFFFTVLRLILSVRQNKEHWKLTKNEQDFYINSKRTSKKNENQFVFEKRKLLNRIRNHANSSMDNFKQAHCSSGILGIKFLTKFCLEIFFVVWFSEIRTRKCEIIQLYKIFKVNWKL